ncbi:MAG: hypothetical protein HY712_07925 [candidate division NC10 bacterium]|nr:hypothetical protein [candidate division NC10 bacterium]
MPTRTEAGVGGTIYEMSRGWGEPPPGLAFGAISDVAVDSKDRVYVFHRGNPPVFVFSEDGTFLHSWGQDLIVDAHGIFITPDDHVFVVDRDGHRVHKCTSDGRVILTLGTGRPMWGAPFSHPTDAAVSPRGEIYVADGYGNNHVHRFSPDGRHLLSWGSAGRGPGEFSVPHGIWADGEDRIYVVDRDNHRLQVCTGEGRFLTEWTGFYRPTDVYMDGQGVIYVSELSTRIHMLDREGKVRARGRSDNQGHGLWGDSKGNLYIASTRSPRIEKHTRKPG